MAHNFAGPTSIVTEYPPGPPSDYRGQRVGDAFELPGGGYAIVMALLPNPRHWCDRGWSCKGSWQVVAVPLRPHEGSAG